MRTTLNIDDALFAEAVELSGETEKTRVVRLGLQALIASAAAKRLAKLGGCATNLKSIPRRRSKIAKSK